MDTARIAILVSGSGTNMARLIESVQGSSNAEVVLVLSNKNGVKAIERARDAGVPVEVVSHKDFGTREAFDAELIHRLQSLNVDVICLAGFMRVLTPAFIDAFPHRILNIHPSLLPSFPGLHAMRQAIEYGVRYTGCTVHLVTLEMDAGPIILQAVVPLHDDDTEDTLAKRIQGEEHRLYPEALQKFLSSDWEMEGRRIVTPIPVSGRVRE